MANGMANGMAMRRAQKKRRPESRLWKWGNAYGLLLPLYKIIVSYFGIINQFEIKFMLSIEINIF